MKMRLSKTLGLFAAALGLTATLTTAPANAADYYEGKTVRLIVGLAPGGTADTLTRAFATVWEKQVPGKPQFVVENMPGGGNVKATNFVYKAKPDGLTILFGPWAPITEVLKDPSLQAEAGKFEYLGGLTDLRVNYVRSDAVPGGFKKATDIMKVQNLKLGGNNTTGIADLLGRMMYDVLGVKYTYVTGFRGGSDIFAAIKRNEVHTANTSISSFRQRSGAMVDSGELKGVAYSTFVHPDGKYERSAEIKEMPAFPDLYKEVHGKMPSGDLWEAYNWFVGLTGDMSYTAFAPPGTPKAVVEQLRKGFTAGCKDNAFVGPLIKKFGIAHDCVPLAEGTRIIKSLADVNPKILASFKKVIAEGDK